MLERLNIKLATPRQCEVNLLGQLRRTGKHCGRPPIAPKLAQAIRDALAVPGRPGFHKIAAQFGVATGTVQRIARV
jgi:hypothetical protein